jgi:hypothetical protein
MILNNFYTRDIFLNFLGKILIFIKSLQAALAVAYSDFSQVVFDPF